MIFDGDNPNSEWLKALSPINYSLMWPLKEVKAIGRAALQGNWLTRGRSDSAWYTGV